MSIEVPNASSSTLSAVTLPAAPKSERGQFFAVPIPRSDPTFGTGLIGAGAYIFKLDPNDNVTPPSVLGAGAFWMNSHSWGGALAGKFYMAQDRFRLLTGFAFADLLYDLTVTSETTGTEQTTPLEQEVYGGLAHAQLRVAKNMYLGLRVAVGKVGTFSSGESLSELPPSVAEFADGTFRLNSIGPSYAIDTRDSTFYPRRGLTFDTNVDIYFGAAGSEITLESYVLDYRQYFKVRETDVIAWQGYVCAVSGNSPFFLQCQVGSNSLLRGYGYGRYRGDTMAALQAEYRWQLHRRWIVAAFGGATQVAPHFGDFTLDEILYAGGAGLRFVVEPKNGVTLRLDYAWGEGERAFYMSIGEAF